MKPLPALRIKPSIHENNDAHNEVRYESPYLLVFLGLIGRAGWLNRVRTISIAPRTLNRCATNSRWGIIDGLWSDECPKWMLLENGREDWTPVRSIEKRPALNWAASLFIVRQFRLIVKRACSRDVNQIIINTGNIWHGLNIVGRKRRQQNRFFSIWSSWTFLDLLELRFEHFLTESLILAQDERWRRA